MGRGICFSCLAAPTGLVVPILVGLLTFAVIDSRQQAAAERRAEPNVPSAEQCRRMEAEAATLAAKVRVLIDAPARIGVLDTFDIQVDRPTERSRGRVAVTIALSANARFDHVSDGVDLWEPGEKLDKEHMDAGFGVGVFEDLPRAIVRFDSDMFAHVTSVRMTVRAWAAPRLEVNWIVSASVRGCPPRQLTPVGQRAIEVVTDPREEALSAGGCAAEEALLRDLVKSVSVSLAAPDDLSVGAAIAVNWTGAKAKFLHSRPVYLVFAVPEWVRFEGGDVIALPAGARAPAAIAFGADRTRVFVPLHMLGTPAAGAFKIKPYRTGLLTVEHAVVASTGCGERILAQRPRREFDVAAGRPEIVIQDFFTVEKPVRIIVSDSGLYRLEIFKQSYRVIDIASGAKIFDRAGRSPNFSPTSRFVAALRGESDDDTGGKMELFDLVAGRQVDFELEGPILGWALQDAMLLEGTYPRGELRLRQSLVDPAEKSEGPAPEAQDGERERRVLPYAAAGWRESSAWEALGLKLDIEHGIAVLVDGSGRVALWELATGFTRQLGQPQAPLLVERYGLKGFSLPTMWDVGEPLRLSHYAPAADQNLSRLTGKRDFPRQKSFLFEHRGMERRPHEAIVAGLADPAAKDWRTRGFGVGGAAMPRRAASFVDQLAPYGIALEQGREPEALVVGTKWVALAAFERSHAPIFAKPARQIEQALLKSVPSAAKLLNTLKPNGIPCTGPWDDGTYSWSFKDQAHGVWHWSFDGKAYWLVQMLCFWKGALITQLYLFVGGPGGTAAIADPFQPLFDGLNDVASESLTRVRPYLMGDGWLLVGSAGAATAVLVNLNETSEIIYLHGLRDAAALSRLFRSKDGRFVVQLNTDGSFYAYPVGAGTGRTKARERESKQAAASGNSAFAAAPVGIRGRWIDDEILLVTDAGHYWGSYEAGHFVHLRLPGHAGLHSIAQFASLLNRPDVVRAAIGGQAPPPAPRLAVPPAISLTVDRAANARLQFRIKATAATRLKAIRVYVDGQLLPEIAVDGRSAKTELEVEHPAQARWLSAVAIDELGLVSSPAVARLEPQAQSRNRLSGVLVGVDAYAERELTLTYAKSDASRLKAALEANRGNYYGQVDLVSLGDAEAVPGAILDALAATVTEAVAGDTVLFFFSGHGVRGDDGHFYLTPAGFRSGDSARTGLAWSRIAAVLDKSKARIIVVLDACHSGLSGAGGLATNDQIAEALSTIEVPMLVLAAAKGRQYAYEHQKWGGGVFTYALVRALDEARSAADQNGNGAIEASELYRALKTAVTRETENGPWGVQTPWLERRNLVGDFALF
jgi:hypothetical protein